MERQMIMGVYRISNTLTGNFYIGSSSDMLQRWVQHKASLRRGDHHNFRLQEDWDKWGLDVFTHTILEESESVNDLLDREQYYMDSLTPYYNVSKTSTFRNNSVTHGDTVGTLRPHIYRVWQNMKTRCTNPNRGTFKYYGGKGVVVCADWQLYENFKYWAINNGYLPSLYLTRNDLNGNYCPSNCQWADVYEKLKSQKRSMRITAFGETKMLREWAKDVRCIPSVYTLHARIISGWDSEQALTRPVQKSIIKNSVRNIKQGRTKKHLPLISSDTEFSC